MAEHRLFGYSADFLKSGLTKLVPAHPINAVAIPLKTTDLIVDNK